MCSVAASRYVICGTQTDTDNRQTDRQTHYNMVQYQYLLEWHLPQIGMLHVLLVGPPHCVSELIRSTNRGRWVYEDDDEKEGKEKEEGMEKEEGKRNNRRRMGKRRRRRTRRTKRRRKGKRKFIIYMLFLPQQPPRTWYYSSPSSHELTLTSPRLVAVHCLKELGWLLPTSSISFGNLRGVQGLLLNQTAFNSVV